MFADGYNGRMEIDGDNIVLTRKLFFGKSKGAKLIALRSITAVQFKPAGLLTAGFIQIAFSGSGESKGGYFDALKDENTVTFQKPQQPQFEAIRDEIAKRRSSQAAEIKHLASTADEIAKLAELRNSGALTDTEFSAAKARLLDGK